MDSSTYLTPLPWNGLVPCYIYKVSKGPNPSLQMEELVEAPVKSTAGMYCCKVCDKSFSRKDNLSRHLLIHSEKKFQCHHCSKCYSEQGKLKIHQTRHHLDAKPISSKNSLVCANCPRCLGIHSILNVTWLCARKNPLKLPSLIWKPWCLKWHRPRDSIVKS